MEVVLAYLLDLLIGDPEGYPHPVRIIGKVVSHLESILRKYAKNGRALRIAGFMLCGFTVTLGICSNICTTFILQDLYIHI